MRHSLMQTGALHVAHPQVFSFVTEPARRFVTDIYLRIFAGRIRKPYDQCFSCTSVHEDQAL